VKKSITVIGIESDGVRGIRLEQNGAEWAVADREFWEFGGGTQSAQQDPGTAGAGGEGEGAPDGAEVEQQSFDRYSELVDAFGEAAKRFGTREVVLSMPLKSLLVNVTRTPAEERDSLGDTAAAAIGKVSPFPDETPVTGVETVAETDSELVTVFAALPSAEADEIGDALNEAKVRILRTDVTALGWLRTLWPKIFGNGEGTAARRVVLMDFDDGWDVVVLDGGAPALLRGLGKVGAAELHREVMLSLLRAGGAAGGDVGEVVVFSRGAVDGEVTELLGQFAPVRVVALDGAGEPGLQDGEEFFGGVEGVALRTQEGASLDVTPSDWVEARTEARFRRKLFTFLVAAAAGWALLMAVLFGVPIVYGQMTEHQQAISKRHAKAHAEVAEMRKKANIVQQYSDHARGALEMLKAISDRMPEGVTKLRSYTFKRGESITLSGEAEQQNDVLDFKDELAKAETEDGTSLFAVVNLKGPSQSKGVYTFSIECLFEGEEEEGK
jgi:hypothetical protein